MSVVRNCVGIGIVIVCYGDGGRKIPLSHGFCCFCLR